jgi:hypothetical protein
MSDKEKKESLKKVRIELIPDKHEAYKLLTKIRKKYHRDTAKAKISLAWRIALKPDKDGHLVLGMCHRTSDMLKEFAECDYVILLNKEVWNDEEWTDKEKKALLDHEMCHAAPIMKNEGHQKRDERKRRCWRIRHHDIEEFKSVVEHHGVWKKDLEAFAEALLKKRRRGK